MIKFKVSLYVLILLIVVIIAAALGCTGARNQ